MTEPRAMDGLDELGRLRIGVLLELWELGFVAVRHDDKIQLRHVRGENARELLSDGLLARLRRHRRDILPVLVGHR